MNLRSSRRLFLSQLAVVSTVPVGSFAQERSGGQQSVDWRNSYEGFQPQAVVPDGDGSYVFAGPSTEEYEYQAGSMTAYDGRTAKITADGDEQWSETYSDQQVRERGRVSNMDFHFYFNDIIRASDGGYLCIGEYNDTNYGYQLGWVVKITSEGAAEWDRYFDPEQGDTVSDVFGNCFLRTGLATANGYLVVGGSVPEGANVDAQTNGLILQLDESGEKTEQWVNQNVDSFESLIDRDGETLLLSGRSTSANRGRILRYELPIDDAAPSGRLSLSKPLSYITPAPDGILAYGSVNGAGAVTKLDADFRSEWSRTYSPWEYNLQFSDAIRTPDGWLLVGSSRELEKAWMIRISESGEKQSKQIYEDIEGQFNAGLETADSEYLFGGDDGDYLGGGWIAQVAVEGSSSLDNQITISSTGQDHAFYGITVDGTLEHGERSNPDSSAAYPDRISGNTVRGSVGRFGTDNYSYSGDLVDLRVRGPAEVTANGESITPEEIVDGPLDRSVTVESAGQDRAYYEFRVDGSLQYGDAANPVGAEYPDRINGNTASGSVASRGVDTYALAGEVTDTEIDGPARIVVDGQVIDSQS